MIAWAGCRARVFQLLSAGVTRLHPLGGDGGGGGGGGYSWLQLQIAAC